MKYDLSKPITRGAKRTLDALSSAMFFLLSGKSFEEITVGALCEQAQYPVRPSTIILMINMTF